MKPHYGIRDLSQPSGPGRPLPIHQLTGKSATSLPSWSRKAALRGAFCQKSEAALRPTISPRDMPSKICVAQGLERGLKPSRPPQTASGWVCRDPVSSTSLVSNECLIDGNCVHLICLSLKSETNEQKKSMQMKPSWLSGMKIIRGRTEKDLCDWRSFGFHQEIHW